MFPPFAEALVIASHRAVLVVAVVLALAGCGRDENAPAAAASDAAPGAGASDAAALESAAASATATQSLAAATIDFAQGNCSAARRKLEYCAACESAEQKPNRDLLLAYCKERENAGEARALYDELITNHPDTEASVLAIMRVRQIDAAALPPLSAYAGPKPTPLERPEPAYPSLAERAGIEGKVRLRFDVREDGGVSNVRVVESSPPLLFDSTAIYAVTSWRYEPGQAAEAQQVVLSFDLSDEEIAAARAEAGVAPAQSSAATAAATEPAR
jgi:TonB family protein